MKKSLVTLMAIAAALFMLSCEKDSDDGPDWVPGLFQDEQLELLIRHQLHISDRMLTLNDVESMVAIDLRGESPHYSGPFF